MRPGLLRHSPDAALGSFDRSLSLGLQSHQTESRYCDHRFSDYCFGCRYRTRRDFKQCCKDSQAIFEGMGKVFTSTVSFIVCAEMLARGLNKIGGISTMIQAAASIQNAGLFIMLIVMLVIMIVAAIVTGSGNAAFFAFSPLLPEAASSVGIPTLALAVPVQLSAGIARTMSPIAGVIIAVSGITGLTPIALIRRTIPVMIIAVIVSVTSSLIFL